MDIRLRECGKRGNTFSRERLVIMRDLFYFKIFGIILILACLALASACNTHKGVESSGPQLQQVDGSDMLEICKSKIVFSACNEDGHYKLYLTESQETSTEIPSPLNGDCITPVFSPDGKEILFCQYDGTDFELMDYNLESKRTIQLTKNDMDDYDPCWASGTGLFAWCRTPKMVIEHMNEAEIYASTWPDFREERISHNGRADCYPVFTVDSKSIIVESGVIDPKTGGGIFGLFQIPMSGKERTLCYSPNTAGNGIPHISGNRVVFEGTTTIDTAKNLSVKLDVFLLDLENNRERQRLTYWNTACNPTPRFSPDGKRIACHRLPSSDGNCQIIILDYSEMKSKERIVIGDKEESLRLPRWNRNGTLLAAEETNKKSLVIIDDRGKHSLLSKAQNYRTQRFLEIYNFDIY